MANNFTVSQYPRFAVATGRGYRVGIGLQQSEIGGGHCRSLLLRIFAARVLDLDEPLVAVVQHDPIVRGTKARRGVDPPNILGLEQSEAPKAEDHYLEHTLSSRAMKKSWIGKARPSSDQPRRQGIARPKPDD
ncbi:hypothetical protein [Bradyrhizobium oligotrophicum]|uniref:hypothetical protein n=1 Tax=Bradyrhizobium oligotrophicum TaxID=44255 RepID=UPI001181AA4C|nr:hypothetical protein [Bradyrhizobium oligotrophicum]